MSSYPPIRFTKRCETVSEREAEIKEALDTVKHLPNQMIERIERHPRDEDGGYPVTLVFRFIPPWERPQEAQA